MEQPGEPKPSRIFDEESGMAVEWLWDEPPMERATHFRLELPTGEAQEFIASYEYEIGLLMRRRPELSVQEATQQASSDPRVEYRAFNIGLEFDQGRFVELWHRLLVLRFPGSKVRVIYSEFELPNSRQGSEWSKSS